MQRALSAWILILIASNTVKQAAVAQAPPAVGTRVRVSLIGERDKLVGTLQEQSSDSLVVSLTAEGGIQRTIGVDRVARLEVSTKRRHPVGKGWAAGTALGALAGALAGALVEPTCGGNSGWCFGPHDTDDMIKAGLVGGAVVGGLVGAIVGAALPSHRWAPVDLSVMQANDAGTGLRMAWQVPLPPLRTH